MTLLFDENLSYRLITILQDLFPGSLHVDSSGLGTATSSATPTIHPERIFGMDRYKNRDQEFAPTDIAYRDFVFSCGSGLQTAIVGIIEDRDQEIAPSMSRTQRFAITRSLPQGAFSRRLMAESANFIGYDLTV